MPLYDVSSSQYLSDAAATRYRFISTDLATDAFYSAFNGSAVSGLIISKALQF